MKNKSLLSSVAVIVLLITLPFKNFAQFVSLGDAGNFVLFTTVGAVGNTSQSKITGNVGTNSGAITGFGNVNGVMHTGDGATASATNSLNTAYNDLNNAIPTAIHTPSLGFGDTLTAGVYDIAGVTALGGILFLDAQNDSNAVFIFKISAAFSSTTASEVRLINAAQACRVFWKIEGAVSLGSLSFMKGNVVANNDAIGVGSGANIEGRLLAINGAINIHSTKAKIPTGCGSAVLNGPAAPNLGNAGCYAIFSGNGEVFNSGITTVKGDVGTNVGLTVGYDPLLVDGQIHPVPDNSTNAAAADLLNARTYLNALTADIELLFPAQFGQGLELTPHTYIMNGAAALTDTVFLNAEGNTDAVFVIQIFGALSSASGAVVSLMNGTQAKNVYWIVNGAITMGTNSNIKGSFISNNGAIDLTTGVKVEGRALTTNGALTTSAVDVSMNEACAVLPLTLVSFNGRLQNNNAVLNWKTSNELNTSHFEIEESNNAVHFSKIGSVAAAGSSVLEKNYSFNHNISLMLTPIVYYRLKMIDIDGAFTYSTIVTLQINNKAVTLSVFPNPVKTTTSLNIVVNSNEQITYCISDNTGRILSNTTSVLFSGNNILKIDASKLAAGVYTISINGTQTKERVQFVKQ